MKQANNLDQKLKIKEIKIPELEYINQGKGKEYSMNEIQVAERKIN